MKILLKSKSFKKELMKRTKTLDGFALELGTSANYLYQLISGIRHPSIKLASKILKRLKACKFEDLFEIEE